MWHRNAPEKITSSAENWQFLNHKTFHSMHLSLWYPHKKCEFSKMINILFFFLFLSNIWVTSVQTIFVGEAVAKSHFQCIKKCFRYKRKVYQNSTQQKVYNNNHIIRYNKCIMYDALFLWLTCSSFVFNLKSCFPLLLCWTLPYENVCNNLCCACL